MPATVLSRSVLLCVGFLLLLAGVTPFAHAQSDLSRGRGLDVQGNRYTRNVVYRPSSADYRFWNGERFDLIYQEGTRGMARRTKRALQTAWPKVDSLIGPVNNDFSTPVIVSGYRDQGGGKVRVFPYYQEIDATAPKSPPISRHSDWAQSVAPHELVHSAQLDVNAGFGLGGLVRLFSPDWARGFNGLYPFGLGEGAAVYLESQLEENAGRLHAPLFTMKMEAAMLSDDPWSLTEMLNVPAYSRPRNRHYVGGAHVFQYLATRGDSTSTEFFHDAVSGQNRFPLLGLGPWLGISIGQFPGDLGSEIRTQLRKRYSAELKRRRPFTDVTVVSSGNGLYNRRPYWLDDSTLVAHLNGYRVREGLYRIDAQTGKRTLIRTQTLPRDHRYSLGRDTTTLLTGRYVADPLVPSRRIAEIERVDLQTGEATRLTKNGGALAPVPGPNGNIYAVKNDRSFPRWGVVEGDSVRALSADTPTSIWQVAPSPANGPTAVVKTVNGEQQIYRAKRPSSGTPQLEPWIALEDAIVYDVSWGPKGRYLLFTADHPETPNIFAFDRQAEEVLHLAKTPFGAREPALSPDRSTLAFANYQHEKYNLVRMPFRPDSATVLPDSAWTLGGTAPQPPALTDADPAPSGTDRSYSAWRHLGPDAVYPTLRGSPTQWGQYFGAKSKPIAAGLEIAGADPLRRWAYRGFAYWEDGRVWGEARLESGRFLLRPSLSAYNRAVTPSTDTTSGLEERGVGLGLRLPVILESNVYRSLLQVGLETQLRETRRYDGGLTGLTPYSTRLTLEPRLALRYRIQQNRRDVIPNTGATLRVEGSFDAWVEDLRSGMDGRHQAIRSSVSLYLPFLRQSHTGLRIGAGLLTQNHSSFDPRPFAPRGYTSLPGGDSGTFLRLDGEIVQPLWYIDDGFTSVPLSFGALSVYGFGQTLGRVSAGGWQGTKASVGGGIGLGINLFYQFSFRLRAGAAYRLGPGDVTATFR